MPTVGQLGAVGAVAGTAALALIVRKPTLAKIDTIILDASIEETHQFASKITQFPIETGETIADHIFNEPKRLTIEGIVSNFPLPFPDPALIARTFKYSLQSQKKYSDAVFKELMQLRDSRKLITVVTRLNSYDNMAILSLTIPRNKDNQEVLRFTIELQEVIIKSTEKVPSTYLGAGAKGASPKALSSTQTPIPASPVQQAQGASVLYKLFQGTKSFLTK